MSTFRVLVCGSRGPLDRDEEGFVWDFLCGYHAARPFTSLVHGAATGVDTVAGKWGVKYLGVSFVFAHPAHWKHDETCREGCKKIEGPSAGPIRNKEMLVERQPDLVIAFPGGRGTANMVQQAKMAKVEIVLARR